LNRHEYENTLRDLLGVAIDVAHRFPADGAGGEGFNNNGSSLIFGHPQGPTGTRLIAEAIEEARQAGGGPVLFVGCAAGDTAAAVVLRT